MDNQDLIKAIDELKDSVDSLTIAERDRFNVDTSHDDMVSLRGKISDLIKSNSNVIA